MAFPHRESGNLDSPLSIAVFEPENSSRDDQVAYSLWKVLCIQAELRVVFSYRRDWQQTRELIDRLGSRVIEGLPPQQRIALQGETAIVVGSRREGETFPYGFVKLWFLDTNLGNSPDFKPSYSRRRKSLWQN